MMKSLHLLGVCLLAVADVERSEMPSEKELEDLVDRMIDDTPDYESLAQATWLGPRGMEVVKTCWLYRSGSRDGDAMSTVSRLACRGLLLVLFGAAVSPGIHTEKCHDYAYLGLPDYGFVHLLKSFRVIFNDDLLHRWPPLQTRNGGVFVDIGSNVKGQFAERRLLPYRPSAIHFFEPVPGYATELSAYWSRRYRNATVHSYGLGNETMFDVPFFVAGGSSSSYHQLHFSSSRLYLDSVGDNDMRSTRRVIGVTMRSVADAFQGLGFDRVSFLSVNCEGCEYTVLQQLAQRGLLARVDRILVQTHVVLTKEEVDEEARTNRCDLVTGTCVLKATYPAINRYCELMSALEESHQRIWGLPFNTQQLWVLRSS